ncbi:MAG: hypothetical protein ACK5SI_08565, partial [Planctomycetia bacterium]
WTSGAKASVPAAGWAALGQAVAMSTSDGAAYAPVPVATATPISLNSRVNNGSANATYPSGMAKRTLYQNIVREAYYLSNLMIGRRPSLNGGMEWAPRASVKPLVADIVVATPPLTPFALAGGGIAFTRQGVGNVSDGIRGRALRGFDSDEIQNGLILGGVGGPVARAFPAVALPMAGVGIGAAAREFQNGEIELAAFDAFLFAKPSTLKGVGESATNARFGQLRDAARFLRDEAGITTAAYRRQIISSFGPDLRVGTYEGQAYQYSGFYGSNSRYLTPVAVNNPVRALALPPTNPAALIQQYRVSPTRALMGSAAPQNFGFPLPGGAQQIFIPTRSVLSPTQLLPGR